MVWGGCVWVLPPLSAGASGASLALDLGPGVIHLWRLCWSGVQLPVNWLSESERVYASQLRSWRRQREFCACRAAWRAVLARFYVPGGLSPAELALGTAAHGKPYLLNGCVSWNASHTKDWAVLAVTNAAYAIGCDVERLDRRIRAPEALAKRLGLMPSSDGVGAPANGSLSRQVLAYWSEREAVAKALGTGLGRLSTTWPRSLESLQIVTIPVVPDQVLATVASSDTWTVQRIETFALDHLTLNEWSSLGRARPPDVGQQLDAAVCTECE
ncbi:hypothetical protein F1559_004538 [Cyanidiococcus yangmingshanensis]|uniref:holo-[acyl-carrier-protein] synthase n=1 Tax=Cyanidiococcus yangmingshanensis TaxID=2690220 RepID=A0A7J7IK71_9RHOD|nr:hypothetical protein F1559_004538 [Cyanidiococcus yangmingshanensis]